MIALSQVLVLVRELFARQIDRESDEMRERMLREIVDVLTVETHDRTSLVRYVLCEASQCGDPSTEARADRALKILDVIEALDALAAHDREARDEAMFARAGSAVDTRRPSDPDAPTRRREAAGE